MNIKTFSKLQLFTVSFFVILVGLFLFTVLRSNASALSLGSKATNFAQFTDPRSGLPGAGSTSDGTTTDRTTTDTTTDSSSSTEAVTPEASSSTGTGSSTEAAPSGGGGSSTSGPKQAVCDGIALTGGTSCDDTPAAGEPSVGSVIKTAIKILSIIVGIAAVIMIIVGGFLYVTSGGDSGKTATAKNTILFAIIGLVIAALAQIIVNFVLDRVIN